MASRSRSELRMEYRVRFESSAQSGAAILTTMALRKELVMFILFSDTIQRAVRSGPQTVVGFVLLLNGWRAGNGL